MHRRRLPSPAFERHVEINDRAVELIEAHLKSEARSGFPTLRRIPSTGAIRFLDYAGTLSTGERDALMHALARSAALGFSPPLLAREDLLDLLGTDPALVAYRTVMQSLPFAMGLRYEGLRMRKATMNDPTSVAMMAQTRSTLDFAPRDDMPPELVPDPDLAHLKPAKAPLMRKLLNQTFKPFVTEKRKLAGGTTGYVCTIDGAELTVWIDFGTLGMQLLYGVSIPDESKRIFVVRYAYENLWVSGTGWDYLTEENAEPSIALIPDLVRRVVTLRNELLETI